jgi:hypothetical protein
MTPFTEQFSTLKMAAADSITFQVTEIFTLQSGYFQLTLEICDFSYFTSSKYPDFHMNR